MKTNDLHTYVEDFHVRSYAKRELARMYFPDSPSDEAAVTNLRNLIRRNPELMDELRRASYRPHDRGFTRGQVRILVRYIGEP